jgi:hypothetical protein
MDWESIAFPTLQIAYLDQRHPDFKKHKGPLLLKDYHFGK